MTRTTAAELDALARIAGRQDGQTYTVEYAYGRPRLFRAGGSVEVSPRLPKGDLARCVNATGSGLVDAIRATVDGAGDFGSARLSADSFVMIEHRRIGPPDGRRIACRMRRVDVADLPSLADYVTHDVAPYDERND